MPDAPGPQGVQAGRLEVPVVADTRGFAAKLRTAVEGAASGLRAVVNVAIDEADLATARAKVEAGMSGIEAEVHVTVDEDRARETLRGAVGRIARDLSAKVRIDADTEQLEAAGRRFAVDSEGTINVGADTKQALAEAEATRQKIDRSRADINVGVNRQRLREGSRQIGLNVQQDMQALIQRVREARQETGLFSRQVKSAFAATDFTRYLQQIGRFTLVAGIFTGIVSVVEGLGSALVGLVGGLSAVVGGLYAIVAATGPAIAGLAVIPNLIGAAAQAGAALFASFSGLGGAVSAILNQRKQATGAATQVADVAANNARQVADARRALADATKNGARQIENAERNLTRAQEQSRFAQENLNDARKDARERLQDLNLELRAAALDEESAAIGLERAKERFNETAANPFATELDKREAELQYQQALQRVDEVAERNDDLAREGGELRARGVEQAEGVVAAKRAIVDAERAEADAARAVADAREQAARSVADAQRNLNDALKQSADGAAGAAAGVDQVQQALQDLSPEAKSFAYFIADELVPALKELRNEVAAELLPTIEDGLRRILDSPLWDTLGDELVETAQGAAKWFEQLFKWLTSPEFNADFKFISDGNQRALKNFGDATSALLQSLTDIMVVVAQPGGLLDRFSEWVKNLAEGWEASTGLNRENGKMFDFFNRGADILGQWGDILGNIWTGLMNIGSAGVPAGETLLDSFENATERFIEWTEENSERLEQWFNDLVPTVESVGRILLKIVEWFGEIADDPNTQAMVKALEEQVGPAIKDFLNALQDSDAGQKFADLLETLVDTLTAIVEAGGFQKFMETLDSILTNVKEFAQENPGIIKFFSDMAGVFGAIGLVVAPMLLFAGGLTRLLRPLSGLLGWMARALSFLGVGGKGAAGKAGRGGLIGALLAAAFGATGIAGGGADTLGTLTTGGIAAYLGYKGGTKLFGGSGGNAVSKLFPSGSTKVPKGGLTPSQVLSQYTTGKPPPSAARSGGLLSRLGGFFKGKGGRVGIIAGIAAALGLAAVGAPEAQGAPTGGAGLLYDPESGLFFDPANSLVYDAQGNLLSYPAASPPPAAPAPPQGYDGVGLALGGGALALGGRSLYKKGLAGSGYVPRAGLDLTKKGASTGIRNAIRSFGPKALKVGAGPIGWGALGVDFLGSAIDSGKADFRGNASSVLKGAGGGAAIGALVGSVVPVIGTALGAAAGTVIGGLVGWLKRPNAELLMMRDNAVDVGENIGKWYNAGRGGELPDLAFRNVATAMQEVGVEAFNAAREQGTYAEALDAADRAMEKQYNVIKQTLMEAYGLTEAQVEELIGTYDEYNARQVLPKSLRADDKASDTIADVEAKLEDYAAKNPPDHLAKPLEAEDRVSGTVDDVIEKLKNYEERPGPDHLTKPLSAEDRVSGTVDDVIEKLENYEERPGPDHLTKPLSAEDRVSGILRSIEGELEEYSLIGPDHLTKDLTANDQASPKIRSVIDGVLAMNQQEAQTKVLTAADRATPLFDGAISAAQGWNLYPLNPKFLRLQSNHAQVLTDFQQWINSIPPVIVRGIQLKPVGNKYGGNYSLPPSMMSFPDAVPGAAEGLTVLPRGGGTLVQVAEAGRPETIVDEGLQNEMLRRVIAMLDARGNTSGTAGVYVADGAIRQHIYNPAPETPTASLSRRQRDIVTFGLAELAGAG